MAEDLTEERVINVTWHGRGGQGAVTAAMILAEAAYLDGYQGVTAAPFFGVERRGAPITATTRFSKKPIRTLSPATQADVVVVLDERLLQAVDVLGGLRADGLLILNASSPPEIFCTDMDIAVATSDANSIAREIGLVVAGAVLINTSLLGAFSKASSLIQMKSLEKAIGENFSGQAAKINIQGARLTYEATRINRSWQLS
ncbi:MAG: 2-oxoacid:acceptor oxidoreductase family protein [Deltaproteobacteria bacterium]|jgi:2-oxoacid:acceptor oxidoreductase gamma subunit (pyruvate/2-ketoisovalerate family)|nr:2-oxoacid:acceptor oxidoreductase family protein [Deltaproteobacteria bacterium]